MDERAKTSDCKHDVMLCERNETPGCEGCKCGKCQGSEYIVTGTGCDGCDCGTCDGWDVAHCLDILDITDEVIGGTRTYARLWKGECIGDPVHRVSFKCRGCERVTLKVVDYGHRCDAMSTKLKNRMKAIEMGNRQMDIFDDERN